MRSGCSSQDFALRRDQFPAFFRIFSPCQRRKSREKTLKRREKRRKICAAIEENQSFMPYSAGSGAPPRSDPQGSAWAIGAAEPQAVLRRAPAALALVKGRAAAGVAQRGFLYPHPLVISVVSGIQHSMDSGKEKAECGADWSPKVRRLLRGDEQIFHQPACRGPTDR